MRDPSSSCCFIFRMKLAQADLFLSLSRTHFFRPMKCVNMPPKLKSCPGLAWKERGEEERENTAKGRRQKMPCNTTDSLLLPFSAVQSFPFTYHASNEIINLPSSFAVSITTHCAFANEKKNWGKKRLWIKIQWKLKILKSIFVCATGNNLS